MSPTRRHDEKRTIGRLAMPSGAKMPLVAPAPAAQALAWLRSALAPGADLHTDSRAVQPGDGFLAYAVDGADNRPHIGDAVNRGARAVLLQPHGPAAPAALSQVPFLPVSDLDKLAGDIASGWYGTPSSRMRVVGVTGTNGKTSMTQWIAQVLGALNVRTAVIGTLGAGMPDKLVPNGFTTPNTAQLQHCLADLLAEGAAAVAMEVSSHALHQGRVNGTGFDVAVLTNLTQDHLDYHRTMEAYEAAKARLFDWPGLRFAVVNRDDPAGVRLLRHLAEQRPEVVTFAYGLGDGLGEGHGDGMGVPAMATDPARGEGEAVAAHCHLYASDMQATSAGGTRFAVHAVAADRAAPLAAVSPHDGEVIEVATLGEFNVSNLLGVLGSVLSTLALTGEVTDAEARNETSAATPEAIPADWLAPRRFRSVLGALTRLQAVAGRMQRLGGRPNHDEPLIVIDYAHTPDALEKTLIALRPVAHARGGELIVAFGCGGDRDAAKRPLMGAIAVRLADSIVLTSDNPRHEAPGAIIDQIAQGIALAQKDAAKGAEAVPVRRIEDRASAILQAVRGARREDVVLLAGKGHEATQDMMGKKRPFSDQDHAQLALAARATS